MYLKNHPILSSQNLDELRDILAKQFTPHELNITKRNHEIDAIVHGCPINNLGLTYLSYGQETPIEAHIRDNQCADIITLNIPITGTGRIQQNGDEWDLSQDKGVAFSMQQPLIFNSHGCSSLALSFPIAALKQHARSLLGDKIDQINFQFDQTIDLTISTGQALRNTIIYAAQEMNGALGKTYNPIAITNLENYLLSQFITLQPNTFMALAQETIATAIMPYYIKRARNYMHDHAHEKITLQDLATHAGCSYRSLQSLFAQVFNMTPMTYLNSLRLERVHEALLDANNKELTVADIAKKWGFVHMGRLANAYKKQYGILPSDTLNQKK